MKARNTQPPAFFPHSLGLLLASLFIFLPQAMLQAADSSDPLFKTAATRAYRPPRDIVDIIPRVEVGKGGEKPLGATIFRPKNPPPGLMPAIVFIHGGGWDSGKSYNFFPAWFAERGYFVMSVEYRLTTEASWPAQIQDCKLAVRWLRANAAEYHVDPDRIGAWGTSAGAHLVSSVGVMDDPALEGAGGYEGVSSHVHAVAAFSAPTDFLNDWKLSPRFLKLCGGVTPEADPAIWKQASPLYAVKAGEPAFLIVHGTEDEAVPFSQAQKFADALRQNGATVEFLPIPGQGHGFWITPTTPESTMQPTHEEIVARLLEFFDKHLKPKEKNAE